MPPEVPAVIARFLNHSHRRFISWTTLPTGLALAASALAILVSSSPQAPPPPFAKLGEVNRLAFSARDQS